jgi:hypothetical protein
VQVNGLDVDRLLKGGYSFQAPSHMSAAAAVAATVPEVAGVVLELSDSEDEVGDEDDEEVPDLIPMVRAQPARVPAHHDIGSRDVPIVFDD